MPIVRCLNYGNRSCPFNPRVFQSLHTDCLDQSLWESGWACLTYIRIQFCAMIHRNTQSFRQNQAAVYPLLRIWQCHHKFYYSNYESKCYIRTYVSRRRFGLTRRRKLSTLIQLFFFFMLSSGILRWLHFIFVTQNSRNDRRE